ncbi:MAG: hypothetical protein M3317_13660 [Actinomycetota bacterium]|nr:hypothetical protein [Actinomycetota bacterium]
MNYVLSLLWSVPKDAKSQSVKRCPVALEEDPEAHGVATLGCPGKLLVTQHQEVLSSAFTTPY